eukprot:m.76277 g.76277  ORF g.76277 m.76277 type:complete len:260 (+) comp12483_c0_seq1:1288-2067(+)
MWKVRATLPEIPSDTSTSSVLTSVGTGIKMRPQSNTVLSRWMQHVVKSAAPTRSLHSSGSSLVSSTSAHCAPSSLLASVQKQYAMTWSTNYQRPATAIRSLWNGIVRFSSSSSSSGSSSSATENGQIDAANGETGMSTRASGAPESTGDTAPDTSSDSDEEMVPRTEGDFALIYTCNVCQSRSMAKFTKHAYHHGVVIITCPSCKSHHLIADNLDWFQGEGNGKNVVEMLKAKGQTVKEIGVTELTAEDLVGTLPDDIE